MINKKFTQIIDFIFILINDIFHNNKWIPKKYLITIRMMIFNLNRSFHLLFKGFIFQIKEKIHIKVPVKLSFISVIASKKLFKNKIKINKNP